MNLRLALLLGLEGRLRTDDRSGGAGPSRDLGWGRSGASLSRHFDSGPADQSQLTADT